MWGWGKSGTNLSTFVVGEFSLNPKCGVEMTKYQLRPFALYRCGVAIDFHYSASGRSPGRGWGTVV